MAPNHLGSVLATTLHFMNLVLQLYRRWFLIFLLSIKVLVVLEFDECQVPICILFFEFCKSLYAMAANGGAILMAPEWHVAHCSY